MLIKYIQVTLYEIIRLYFGMNNYTYIYTYIYIYIYIYIMTITVTVIIDHEFEGEQGRIYGKIY